MLRLRLFGVVETLTDDAYIRPTFPDARGEFRCGHHQDHG
jgi:hypothetical protein